MYGSYELNNFSFENEYFRIEIEKQGDFFHYTRLIGEEREEKIIASEKGRVILTPIEPVNLPKEITNYLQIKLSKPVLLSPSDSKVVYLKFPIEIGVFLAWKRSTELLDVFSLNKPKYTLYGEPKNGVICRYWESEVYRSLPNSEPLKEGIIRLRMNNLSSDWISVNHVVFDVYGMKMFYDEFLVFSDAEMRIASRKIAETQFYESPLRKGMKKALELYVARRIIIPRGKFTMEWGL